MAATNPTSDPFVDLSLATWEGLNSSVRELTWIRDGGDPTATFAERDEANLKAVEYDRDRIRVMQQLVAYLAKKLSVTPPTPADLARSRALSAQLAQMVDVNVKVTVVVKATTELLDIYGKSASLPTTVPADTAEIA